MAWMYETQKHIVNMKRSAKADLMTSQHKIRGLSQVVEAVCFYLFFLKRQNIVVLWVELHFYPSPVHTVSYTYKLCRFLYFGYI